MNMRTKNKLTPLRAIREKCLDCQCESSSQIVTCSCTDCTLWFHRFGKRPETVKEKDHYLWTKRSMIKTST